jgi:hypothetical protein
MQVTVLEPQRFFMALGGLHDCTLLDIIVDCSGTAQLVLSDILANFCDGEGADQPLPAKIYCRDAELDDQITAMLAEGATLWIYEFSVLPHGSSFQCQLQFAPAGASLLKCSGFVLETSDLSKLAAIAPDAWEALAMERTAESDGRGGSEERRLIRSRMGVSPKP